MAEDVSELQAAGLTEAVRSALVELVERGLATPDQLRKLGDEGPRLVADKVDLLDALESRAQRGGLTVTAGTLTNLAVINQIYGFDIGDLLQELVRATAELVLREEDPDAQLAQIAGAQFVILHGADDHGAVAETVRRVQKACNVVALNRHQRSVVPRVAMVSLEIPADEELDGTEILKILGYSQLRTRPSHLEPVILSRDVDHRQWQAALRKREAKASRITDALRRGAVEIHFQPVIELATRDLYNVEVLARIRTDEGLMTATEFIDSVYQLGEIVELDSQVFSRLGDVASELAGITGHLFINVSPISLLSPDFLEIMGRTMEKLRGEGLGMVVVLELTEQAIVEHLDIIHELHTRHDVKFAVDDFGTGYSSLKTVSDLATSKVISHLKLDGSLIKEIEQSREAYKVVLAIANLAKSLDLTVVAEHVESESVLGRLRTIGVDLGQGELFDMPLPLAGLLSGYRNRPTNPAEPVFARPDFDRIVPYLDRAFQSFYDRLLSNEHFSAFFEDQDQIRSLVDRQRASFVESMTETDDQLRTRYVALGRLHYQLGVPFPSFMKGTEILNEELLGILAHVDDRGVLVFQSSLFFRRLQNLLARGYLDGVIAEEEVGLGHSLDGVRAALSTARAPSLDWIGDLVEAVRVDRHDAPPRPEIAVGDAVEWLRERVSPLLTKDSVDSILGAYRALHADGDSLAFFLGEQEYQSVLMLYRQVHDRVVTLQRSLHEAGLA
jgi:EAL domain-containing protein (putative c-di-GMP-specific phosphodiesterase class I)/GGDEF domain-containing protein